MIVYIASRSEDRILRCTLTEEGKLVLLDQTPADQPAWLCREGNLLYALLREPFQLMSGVEIYRMEQDGALTLLSKTRSTHGLYSAHLYAENGNIWIANYIEGTVALLYRDAGREAFIQDKIVAFTGSGPNRERQKSSHPHCITPTPDGRYLCVNDLGTDRIYLLTKDLDPVSDCELPAGCGPRHLVFSPDGRFGYSVNEMGSSVSVLKYDDGKLNIIKTVSSLPTGISVLNTASGIQLSEDGSRLYVSNRGHDSVSVFRVEGSELSLLGSFSAGGVSPRVITLVGDFLLCANELSDNVTVFPLKHGIPNAFADCLTVKMPWGVLAAEI